MQRVLTVEFGGFDIVWTEECCYGRHVRGDGIDALAADVQTLKHGGFFFLDRTCKRPFFWYTFVTVEGGYVGRWFIW